jgi:UDP-2,3-diacylglucosamine pyrophosphatase LpxH
VEPFLRASTLSQDDYDSAIAAGLDRVYEATRSDPIQLSELRAVVISDLHRGARDGADDFQRAEPAYSAALGSYLEQGYELWLLGDVEELWENDLDEVVPDSYRQLLALEMEFASDRGGPGLRRFWGNHDLDWKDEDNVDRYLGEFLPGVRVGEALRLEVRDGENPLGELFMVHGHQGTDFSERFQFVSRFFVRRIWREVQTTQGWLSTTPSYDYELRAKHDTAMFRWARGRVSGGDVGERPLLIAGHTHHPVFPGKPPKQPDTKKVAELEAKLEQARANGEGLERLAQLRADLENVRAKLRRERYPVPPEINDPPCYFNGGCCCYPDGDITCLELDGAGDEIRLVRWPRDEAQPDRTLPKDSLRGVFQGVNTAG